MVGDRLRGRSVSCGVLEAYNANIAYIGAGASMHAMRDVFGFASGPRGGPAIE